MATTAAGAEREGLAKAVYNPILTALSPPPSTSDSETGGGGGKEDGEHDPFCRVHPPISVSLCELEVKLRSATSQVAYLSGQQKQRGEEAPNAKTLVHKVNTVIQGGTMFAILGGSGTTAFP
jgi:hypothetical protein